MNDIEKLEKEAKKQLKQFKRLSNEDYIKITDYILRGTKGELVALKSDPNTPMLQVALISAILADMDRGVSFTIDKILERVLGKPKEHITHASDPDNPMGLGQAVQVLITMPDNGRSAD